MAATATHSRLELLALLQQFSFWPWCWAVGVLPKPLLPSTATSFRIADSHDSKVASCNHNENCWDTRQW